MSDATDKPRGLLGRLFGRAERKEEPEVGPAAPAAAPTDATPIIAEAPAPATHAASASANLAAEIVVAEPSPQSDAVELGTAAPPSTKRGWFQRLSSGLAKTSSKLTEGITGLFTKRKLDATTLDDLEDLLIQADLGVQTATRITEALRKGRYEKGISAEDVRVVLANEVERVLTPVARPLEAKRDCHPHVILVVGVNGTGKTTTIGKLAQQFRAQGLNVMMAAGDTFRAAAIDQLKIWGQRTGTPVVAHAVGSDAAGLAFDAVKEAKRQASDVLLIDTAGRLQNKQGLMEELEKVVRVIRKLEPAAPHDVLLVLDATTGQNALNQVEVFRDRVGVTGLVMTKLDGTARGGILVAISEKYNLPVHAIGVGESVDDLQPFDAREFARAIASN